MNYIDNEVKNTSVPAHTAMEKQRTEHKLSDYRHKNYKHKKKAPSNKKEKMNTVRLLGEPLVTHGPYSFYGALAYRKRGGGTRRKCCCNDLCSCDGYSSSSSCSSSQIARPEWSVVRMNHFYAVRPWYSKNNSSINERQELKQQHRHNPKHSAKLATSTSAEQHHYQQSVCIGELELLWRDDSVITANKITAASSSVKKCASSNGSGTVSIKNRNNSHVGASSDDDDDDVVRIGDAVIPRRRMLPRRTRQPSAKKLEAAESSTAKTSDPNGLPQSSNYRGHLYTDSSSLVNPVLSSPGDQYTHGNLLCSVRLYVMPDQTASGRLSGVHGEDEVLEINPWGTGSRADRWPGNLFVNSGNGVRSIYNSGSGTGGGGVDDYCYGSGSHSSGALPSGCSGLVLRAEDFVEWIRGGRMNDDENDTQSDDDESFESESDYSNVTDRKPTIEKLIKEHNSGGTNERPIADNYFTKSAVDEAVEAEGVPLAAAKIHKNHVGRVKKCYRKICRRQHRLDCTMKNNCREHKIKPIVNKVDEKSGASVEKCHCYCCKRRRRSYQNSNKEIEPHSGKQRLVIMSYSRYCRYRAQLQRKREEQFTNENELANNDTERAVSPTYQGVDSMSTTRVLFCRDTYDYPAELLLEPFNAQQNHKSNTNVLVNHMAPKLKGWPSYPASWMSFRWNRVRRRLRHLERGSGNQEERLRRRRRRKLKKKCPRRQNGAGGAAAVVKMKYSSSTEDDDSDSDEASSATNDAATNTTTTVSTSDSEDAQPTKRRNVAYSPTDRSQVNRPTVHRQQVGIYHVPQRHVKPKQPQQQSNRRPRQPVTINQIISQTQKKQHKLSFETEQQRQQQEQEERQRHWLVDALRMGGLEVTLVPLNNSGDSSIKKKD